MVTKTHNRLMFISKVWASGSPLHNRIRKPLVLHIYATLRKTSFSQPYIWNPYSKSDVEPSNLRIPHLLPNIHSNFMVLSLIRKTITDINQLYWCNSNWLNQQYLLVSNDHIVIIMILFITLAIFKTRVATRQMKCIILDINDNKSALNKKMFIALANTT